MLLNQIKAKSKRSLAGLNSPDDWNVKKRQRLTWTEKNNQPEQVHLDLDPMQTQSHVLAIGPNDEVMVTDADESQGFLDHNFWKISPNEYLQSLENAML
mmetsp:Transcript_101/g.268  ORF Transcript_101/g.268 Transcript_101/m.268 type:complete len:99 (+) Transcript_101:3-299(+)